MGAKRVAVVGATGMVGGLALRTALDDPRVGRVTAVVRRSTGVTHAKLVEIVHADFLDFATVLDAFADQDVALFCVGAYTGQVPDEEFRKITVDCAAAFAKALFAKSPGATVSFLSGQGADPTEKSSMSFARYKGAAEKLLLATGFARVHIFRPGYIYPVTPRVEPNFSYRLFRGLYPALRVVYPNVGIASDALAWAMLEAALEGTGEHTEPVLENRDIRALAARRQPA